MIWWILLAVWALLYIVSILLAFQAGEDKMSQPLTLGLVPILGSLFTIYSYCVIISLKSPFTDKSED